MPYNKRHEDCTNASGEKGTFVTIKKEDGKRQCWKSEAAFKRTLAARHANESYSREEIMEAVHEVLEEYYSEEALDEEQLEEKKKKQQKGKKRAAKVAKRKSKKKKKKRCWNKRPECGSRDYSKEPPTAGNEGNKARKRHKRKYESENGKCPAGQELHHVNGLSSSEVRCEPVSTNRGRKGEGGRKKKSE